MATGWELVGQALGGGGGNKAYDESFDRALRRIS